MSETRHAVNNHLTAALAEVQLLAMDADSPDARESCEAIRVALRRIADIVSSTAHFTP